MKAHDLLWKSLGGLFACIVGVAATLTTAIFSVFIIGGWIKDFFDKHSGFSDFAKAALIFVIFLAFYLFSAILMAP